MGGLLLVLGLTGCDGSNLFSAIGVPSSPPPPAVDVRAEVLRYLEEATLLTDDTTPLRFRWRAPEPLLILPSGLPFREREAFRRGAALIQEAGGPRFRETGSGLGTSSGFVEVEALTPADYRTRDPTRPWSFSRTFVTATPETGITQVQILVSLELGDAVLERAALHALGHAIGLMGHPSFPGSSFVMAVSPEDAAPPTTFHPWERTAIGFLYSPAVQAGMTRSEIRTAWGASAPFDD